MAFEAKAILETLVLESSVIESHPHVKGSMTQNIGGKKYEIRLL